MSTANSDGKKEGCKEAESSSKKEEKSAMIVDDDEFEEFKAQDISFSKHNLEPTSEQIWDENWEDEQEESEFVKEVQRILAEGGYEQKQ